jgi:hypothetical protein
MPYLGVSFCAAHSPQCASKYPTTLQWRANSCYVRRGDALRPSYSSIGSIEACHTLVLASVQPTVPSVHPNIQQHTAMESQFMLLARYFTGNMAPEKIEIS